jgi:hypothetical protein
MNPPGTNHPQLTFADIHHEELSEIKKRREKQCYEHADIEQPNSNLVGLALSGGGIRSATFCLGFLQELQRLRLLRIFDYLSTVSGGGYLGGWWSAWLSRRQEDTRQDPCFEPKDIGNATTLLKRIVEAPDAIAEDLRIHMAHRERGQKLLELVQRDDFEKLAPRLYEPLALELNSYIDLGDTIELKWQRRAGLVETFPCELRGLFPPEERIEPDRERGRDVNEKQSDGSRCAWEDPVHHLRLFANYLTPRKGILSADTWRAVSVVSRNLILTWLILLPLLAGVMLISQAYLLLHPTSHEAFICPECSPDNLWVALRVILVPIFLLLVSTVVMAIAWLLCNRDSSASVDWMVQWIGLFTLGLMVTAAVIAIPTLRDPIVGYFNLPDTFDYFIAGDWYLPVPAESAPYLVRMRSVGAGVVALLVIVLCMWNWNVGDRAFRKTGVLSTGLSSWKREIRRGRFGRAQAQLLVTTAVVSVVLLLSWLTCVLSRNTEYHFGLKIPLALLPILSAIGGSIFTALRATPVAEGDRATSRQPSMVSRFVFATTPPLVVGVLAVFAAYIVHWLLLVFLSQRGKPFGNSLFALLDGAPVLLTMLCMGLAIYELEDVQWSKVFKLSLSSVVFMCLVMVNVSWVAQVLLRYGYRNPEGPWTYLLVTSASLAVLITALIFRRMIPKGKWKWRLFRHLDFVRRRVRGADHDKKHVTAFRLVSVGSVIAAVMLIGALTTVGFLIGVLIFLNTTDKAAGKVSGALVLTFLALGGGVILFRLVINRVKTKTGENVICLRLLGQRSLAQRPEALWLAASVCLTLPIVMICVGHFLMWRGDPHHQVPWKEALTLFPLAVAAMLLSLMVLRVLVIQKRLIEGKPIAGWAGGIFEWLLDRVPKAGRNRRRAYQLIAMCAICAVSLLDTIMRGLAPGEAATTMGAGPVNWPLMGLAFVVSLPVFGVSVFQIPINTTSYERFKGRSRPWLHSKIFLWLLATVCVGWALLVGLLLPKWLRHVADIPLNTGLTPLLLPVAAGFLLIVLFEIYWGERDNRRSLLLVSIGYLGAASIFYMNLAGASLNWHLVIGLLAAICVWVAALGWMVDPNAVSMHQFYKGRLVRAYLGASNVRRFKHRNKEITETVAGDDLPLKLLINCDRGGPYHLVNTTLNLVAGRDLATAQRSASSFVLSQTYCGSTRTKYCRTNEYMNGQLTLGTSVAASGAAVSPNMGAKKPTSALAMLMTLLNVRLGYWAPTPNRKGWNSAQPRLWPFYLVREFLSQTNDLSDYCYLTDGGHFDNTGLYSLIERGCRFVVLVDCGADPGPPCFEDLGEAIRRCRIDFGTEIDLNLDPFIKKNGSEKNGCDKPASCVAVGKIKFSPEHLRSLANGHGTRSDRYGIIVYFKPSVIPNVTADVRQYAIENTFFPQQPTTNQWFGEAQFESYRRLGQACAHNVFGHLRSEKDVESRGRISTTKIEKMFGALLLRIQRDHK